MDDETQARRSANPDPRKGFAELVVALGYATRDAVRAAQAEQERCARHEHRRIFLAEVLMARGVLSYEELLGALECGRGYRETESSDQPLFGELAVRKGYATAEHVFLSLLQQRDEDAKGGAHRPIGEILLEAGFISAWELEDLIVTAADLGYSDRSGETPSEAIPLDPSRGGSRSQHVRRLMDVPGLDGELGDAWDEAPAPARGSVSVKAPERPAERPSTPGPAPARQRVSEVMQRPLLAASTETVGELVELLRGCDRTSAVVIEDDAVVGILDLWDLLSLSSDVQAARILPRRLITISPDATVAEAVALIREHDVGSLPVLMGESVVGVITRDDLRRAGVKARDLSHKPLLGEEPGGGD